MGPKGASAAVRGVLRFGYQRLDEALGALGQVAVPPPDDADLGVEALAVELAQLDPGHLERGQHGARQDGRSDAFRDEGQNDGDAGAFAQDMRLAAGAAEFLQQLFMHGGCPLGLQGEKRMLGKLGERNRTGTRERPAGRQNGGERIGGQIGDLISGRIGVELERQPGDDQLDLSRVELLSEREVVAFMNLERHLGIAGMELPDRLRQQGDAGNDGSDGQHAADALSLLAHLLERIGEFPHEPLRPFEQQLAGGGKPQAAAGAVEQPDAELLLHLPELAAERRLLHMQGAGGPRNLAFPGDRREIIQLAHIHIEILLVGEQWKKGRERALSGIHTWKVWEAE
ncbi:hypothetical protein BN871_BX_00130 [Paenibacillus sp. P22]|nr:hypothetical protein BN871_BX_00130 [Paenibacillus sp. P22]